MKTPAEFEADNAELRARLARAEKTIDRLLAEPPKVEVHREVVKEFVPYPCPVAPYYTPPPALPNPWIPIAPWWQIQQPDIGPTWTYNAADAIPGANAGCAPMVPAGTTVWVGKSTDFAGAPMAISSWH